MITKLILCAICLLASISSACSAATHDEVIKKAEANKYSYPWNDLFKMSYNSMIFANVVMWLSGVICLITLFAILFEL